MKAKAILSACTESEVAFYDVDSMRVVWHGNYVKYLEVGRCELLKLLDYNYTQMEASGYAWPIVDMRLKYVASARLHDIIVITAGLVEWENRLKIEYVIKDKATGKVLTKGYSIQVALDIASGEMQYQSPSVLLDKVKAIVDAG